MSFGRFRGAKPWPVIILKITFDQIMMIIFPIVGRWLKTFNPWILQIITTNIITIHIQMIFIKACHHHHPHLFRQMPTTLAKLSSQPANINDRLHQAGSLLGTEPLVLLVVVHGSHHLDHLEVKSLSRLMWMILLTLKRLIWPSSPMMSHLLQLLTQRPLLVPRQTEV